jgi:hypothetical protein
MVSTRQRAHVDKRVEFTCITNSHQQTYKGVTLNIHAAIRLAFVLGTRFGLAQPTVAGDFMARWIADHTLDTNTEELAARHQRAMLACVFPLQYTSDEYDNMEGDEDDE